MKGVCYEFNTGMFETRTFCIDNDGKEEATGGLSFASYQGEWKPLEVTSAGLLATILMHNITFNKLEPRKLTHADIEFFDRYAQDMPQREFKEAREAIVACVDEELRKLMEGDQ